MRAPRPSRAGQAVVLRAARPGEAACLGALATAAKAGWGYARAELVRWRAELEVSAAEVSVHPTRVAEVGGRMAGFFMLIPGAGRWRVEHFWVAPGCQRRGVGRAMLADALAFATRAGAPGLAIDADPNAERFYLACGAERTGSLAAPIAADPGRRRPQLVLDAGADAPPGSAHAGDSADHDQER